MTSVRKLRKRHAARAVRVARIWGPDRFDGWGGDLDDDDYDDVDLACTHCGGEGWREVDDLMWDDCDEFGYGPCTSCNGTGDRRKQWVF